MTATEDRPTKIIRPDTGVRPTDVRPWPTEPVWPAEGTSGYYAANQVYHYNIGATRGRDMPPPIPTLASRLTFLLVDVNENRPQEVAAAIARVTRAGLDIADQPDGDTMLSTREVRAVHDLIFHRDDDWCAFQYHTECCPNWCANDSWHVGSDGLTTGIVEHGHEVARGVLPQVRRTPHRVTRPDSGGWVLTMEQRAHKLPRAFPHDNGGLDLLLEDRVLVLTAQTPEQVDTPRGTPLRMLPAEALALGETLITQARTALELTDD